MKLQSLKIILILLGWIAIQSTVIGHEFSEEHWFSSSNHLCLSQATHFDDLIPTTSVKTALFSAPHHQIIEFNISVDAVKPRFAPKLTRAPPLNS